MNLVYKALSDPTRRKILELLRTGDKTAGELGQEFPHTAPTMSKHFSVLKDADLIQGDKSGTSISYRLNVSLLEEAMLSLLSQFKLELSQPAKE
ncbi:MAG: autorepressor SdpR family transcription factor [bacterium]|nr:ArsR family transcriptional regulator [Gammaproteobacteria bacterium]